MTKRENIENENSCWNKADCDELLFILKAKKDKAMPATIRFWIEERIRLGMNKRDDPKLVSAEALAQRIEVKQKLLVDSTDL